jgi:hypothetical protein
VVPPDFVFALAVSGGAPREMLLELVARVLDQVGCSGDGGASLGDELHAAMAQGARDQPVDIRFRAEAGRLEIVVSSPAGAIWRTFRDIESSSV